MQDSPVQKDAGGIVQLPTEHVSTSTERQPLRLSAASMLIQPRLEIFSYSRDSGQWESSVARLVDMLKKLAARRS